MNDRFSLHSEKSAQNSLSVIYNFNYAKNLKFNILNHVQKYQIHAIMYKIYFTGNESSFEQLPLQSNTKEDPYELRKRMDQA